MAKKKPVDAHSPEGKTKIVALCGRCDRVSGPFFVPAKDLVDDNFAASVSSHYGACQCGAPWVDGRPLREPDAPPARMILLERENKRLRENEKVLKTRLESYERAMSLMGGGPMRGMRTFMGIPY